MTQYFRLIGTPRSRGGVGGARPRARRPACATTPFWVVANTYLGTAYDAQGEYRKAADVLRKCVEALPGISIGQDVRVAGLVPVFSRIYLATASPTWATFREGLAYGNEGTRLAESADDAYSLIFASCGVGTLHLLKGDVEPAIPSWSAGSPSAGP